jgi:glucose/arabinose dehydrogenase
MTNVFTLASIILIFSFTTSIGQPNSVTVGSTTLDVRVVIEGNNENNGIDIPWEIQWGSDDHIWMTERFGRVSRLNPTTGARTTILDLTSSVYASSESGLLGLQLHPDFENTPQVFLAYTYISSGIKERIVRYDYNSTSGLLENPFTLIEGINGNTTHIGCRLLILPEDSTLLATTGDYQTQPSAQDDNSLSGKILRMNLDGSIPMDNPFGSSSYVYSKGHRNAQGLLVAPNGNIYSSEHGPSSNDEFNLIVPGGNYGWPDVNGFCNTSSEMSACNAMSNYQDPMVNWYNSSTIAPSDIVLYNHPAIPEWQGKILMTVLKTEHLKVLELSSDGLSIASEAIMFNLDHANNPTSSSSSTYNNGAFERLRDICVSPDGRLFLATSGSSWGTSGTFTNTIVELKNSAYIATGIVDANLTEQTQIFPNPNTGNMNLVFDEKLVGGNFTVTDKIGKTVYSGQVNTVQQRLNLSNLGSGLYILQARSDNYTSNERILITE